MDSSSFSDTQPAYPDAELLTVGGSTCDCYRVKLYGKFHFMKRLKPELRTDPRYVSAMQKEFETGYRLEHPHLVRYVSKGDDYLLTEYVDGENLRTFTDSHPDYFKSRKNADRFLRQLLDVVGYLHQHQVVHLDLKPDNILITRIGYDVKLTDLGYCYTDTYTDTMGRTDKYAAPEQINGLSKVDARTDIYAIGKILQTLPCAHIYYKVIARCTAEDPSKRYQTIDDFSKAINTPDYRKWLWLLPLLLMVAIGLYLYWPRTISVAPSTTTTTISSSKDSVAAKTDTVAPPTLSEPEPISESKQEVASQPPVPAAPPEEEATSDTLSLRQELQRRIAPLYQKALGSYNDSAFNRINEQYYFHRESEFEESIIPLYTELWNKYKDKVSKHTMQSEWHETIKYFHLNQILRMQRNVPNHDPYYDNREYHYYDTPY